MKVESADSLSSSDSLGRKFEKFLSLAKQFFAKGHRSISRIQNVPLLDLRSIITYEQFEDWIFKPKDPMELLQPNMVHEKCLMMPPWDERFSNTERLKIAGWMTTLIRFDRVKLIRGKVSGKKVDLVLIVSPVMNRGSKQSFLNYIF